MMNGGADFSGENVVNCAQAFLANRMETFQKDIARCLIEDCKVEQAYFPALMTCIAFAEFMSCLNAGKIDAGNQPARLEKYIMQFLPKGSYVAPSVEILYKMFRHKLAHLAYPHGVLEFSEKGRPRRIIWEVFANEPKPPIKIDYFDSPKYLNDPVVLPWMPPWRVRYDCKVTIGLRAFHDDIVRSVANYLDALKSNRTMQDNFGKSLREIFPPNGTHVDRVKPGADRNDD
jgi:hypothetical protein